MLTETRRLPLWSALAVFILYVCTMGSGGTLNGLALTVRLAGWSNAPQVGQPLLWLLTLPLHVLPAAWMVVTLKIMSAALAAAVMAVLTRTVQLLPWDRPWAGANPVAALLPVLTACALCGLEFSYWEEATSSCGELLDLLMLALALWLMQEYRVRRQPAWLDAATVVWGAGMAENWVMIFTLPLFVAGVAWLLRIRILRWKLLLRLTWLGLAGFAVYAVLPLANGLAPHSPWSLGQSWSASLHQTRGLALALYYSFWRGHRLLTIAVMIYFLVPTLPLLVKLRDEGTRHISGVDRFQLWIYRGLRLGLLLACFWLAFDPTVAARQMIAEQMGTRLPMLTLDYLTALGAAFLMGNLLLMAQPVPGRDDPYRSRSRFRWTKAVLPAGASILAMAVIGLLARNAPAVVRGNFHPAEEFGDAAVKSLPAGSGVVLSDSPEKLEVFEMALARSHAAAHWQGVDTHTLPSVEYRGWLERRHPAGWLTESNRHELSQLETLRLVEQMTSSNHLVYLHPGYGYIFETFYSQPTGMVYELKLRGHDPLDVPPLSTAAADGNEQFWSNLWDHELGSLVPQSRNSRDLGEKIESKLARLGVVPAVRAEDHPLGQWYSMALESWAVALQREGRLPGAHTRLEQALELNSNNISARITLVCNTNLQSSNQMTLSDVPKVSAQLGTLDRLNLILDNDGQFDEPTMDFILGSSFLAHKLVLQAADQLERARKLAPGSVAAEEGLAELYNQMDRPDRSRPLIAHLKEAAAKLSTNNVLDMDVALLESYSWMLQTNLSKARGVLASLVAKYPDDPQIGAHALAAYMGFGDVTNALGLVDAQIARSPDNVTILNNKATILVSSGHNREAITILDHILSLTNDPAARLNRAYALMAMNDFARAQIDLTQLQYEDNRSALLDFGLANVAAHNQDTNQAVRYLHQCLTNAPTGSPLWQQATVHLRALQPGAKTN